MQRDEILHPGHHTIRLKGFDYSLPGSYFVTICAADKRKLFGRIVASQIELSKIGKIILECWNEIPRHFAAVAIHTSVLMPNHIHGIIGIGSQKERKCAAPLPEKDNGRPTVASGSLGAIVRSFKSAAAKRAHQELGWKGEVWQRNYFERILRDGQEFADAIRYIAENPMKWEWDKENPEGRRISKSS
jgi:REP element-mobilizing transposase RayT